MEVKDSVNACRTEAPAPPEPPSTSSGTTSEMFAPPVPITIAYTTTASTGPTEEIPVSPKELSCLLSPARTEDTPRPSAIIKGTVIGPVVAPPESKPISIKDDGAKNATTKRIV